MNDRPATLLTADWIAPLHRSGQGLIRRGGIVVKDDGIVDLGEAASMKARHPHSVVYSLGAAIILPGLVNAHVHLELSDLISASQPSNDFGKWLLDLVARGSKAPQQVTTLVETAVAEGVKQCIRFGVTSVGDISRQCQITRPLLRDGPLRVTSYGEIQALAQRRTLLAARLASAMDPTTRSNRLCIGISPHAPYTVEPEGYTACLNAATDLHLPLATHLAEAREEVDFLATQTGPFRELWESIGQWDKQVPLFNGGPIRLADSLGLLDYPTLLAHVNYCDDDELNILAKGRASVVYCPRTHSYFGHPPHRFREMQGRGINVALGTDSCASSPDLNLVDDLRCVHDIVPSVPSDQLWELITQNAAHAIADGNRVGSLAIGKAADFTVFAAATDDPLNAILKSNRNPIETWIAGVRVNV